MKVADLQRLLGPIVEYGRAAGASEKVAAELARVVECFEPFKDRSLAELAEFLRRADEYDRTGKLEAPAKASKPRAAKAPALSVDEAAAIFTDLHTRATDETLTFADIDAKLKPLDKLTVAQLKEVAAKVQVTVPGKTKKAILEELTRRIKELKASHQRTQFQFGEKAEARAGN